MYIFFRMHIIVLNKPEYCEKNSHTVYKFNKTYEIFSPISKYGVITFEVLATYGLGKKILQRGYVWQCRFNIFISEPYFKQCLESLFNKPYNDNNTEIKLNKLSIIPIKELTNAVTYHEFEIAFLTNIRDRDISKHCYFKVCNGKFYFNMDDNIRHFLEHASRVKRQLADAYMLKAQELIKVDLDENLRIIFKNKIREIFLKYLVNFSGDEIYEVFKGQMVGFLSNKFDTAKKNLIIEILKELEPYRKININKMPIQSTEISNDVLLNAEKLMEI